MQLKKPYFSKPSSTFPGMWAVMRRLSAANGGGTICITILRTRADARMLVRIKNLES
jgi:hypothetical protein